MKFTADSCEVGQLLCAALSQLEAEEDESFQGKTMGSTNSTVRFVLFWLVSLFTFAYRHLTQSTA